MSEDQQKPSLMTDDEVVQAWLAAKAELPTLEKAAFAENIGRPLKTVERILKPVFDKEVTILSRYIASEIGKAAEVLKVDPWDMTWWQFKHHIDMAWGANNAGIKSHHITQAGGFNRIRDAFFPPAQTTRQQVEKYKMAQYAFANRKTANAFTEQKIFADNFLAMADLAYKDRAKGRGEPSKPAKDVERALVAVLSDLHFGSDTSASETGVSSYGRVEEARRLARVAYEIADYKRQYRGQTKLVVALLGDIIDGILHNLRDGADYAEQVTRAIHLLIQFFEYVLVHFTTVEVYCATGNHDRITALHPGRATSKKHDSFATIIYASVKAAFASNKRITFTIPKTPFVEFSVFGNRYYATHGDTNFSAIGNPNKALNMAKIEAEVNKLNATRSDDGKIDVVLVGHTHVSSQMRLSNGTKILTNGCLPPPNAYATMLGYNNDIASQWVFETIAGFPVGDSRELVVNGADDKNADLDKVIAPWNPPPDQAV